MSDVSPLSGISGLSFDSTLLSPLLFFCLVLLRCLSYRFLPAGPFFSTFSRKFFNSGRASERDKERDDHDDNRALFPQGLASKPNRCTSRC